MLKTKFGKRRLCIFRRLRVNGQFKFLQRAKKRVLSFYFGSFSLPNAKKSKIKAFLKVTLVSLTLRLGIVIKNF